MKSTIPFLAAISFVGVAADAVADKIAQLRLQGTQVERINLLQDADVCALIYSLITQII